MTAVRQPFISLRGLLDRVQDERESAFSLGTFADKTFAITTSVSFVLLVLSTVQVIFQTVMKTTSLDFRQ